MNKKIAAVGKPTPTPIATSRFLEPCIVTVVAAAGICEAGVADKEADDEWVLVPTAGAKVVVMVVKDDSGSVLLKSGKKKRPKPSGDRVLKFVTPQHPFRRPSLKPQHQLVVYKPTTSGQG